MSDITSQKTCISCKKEASLPQQAQCKTCRQISSKKNYSKRKDRLLADREYQSKQTIKKINKKLEKLKLIIDKFLED